MYVEDQDWFLNCVLSLETDLGPRELLEALHSIEGEMGRKPGLRYGPREIDLDILFYDGLVSSEPALEIPHPRISERLFVLAPLEEIAPDFIHPVTGKSVSDMRAALKSDKKVIRRPGILADLSR